MTTIPSSFGDDIFMTGLAWLVPVTLPGWINPVSWTARFSSDVGDVSLHWKWGAAVYTEFTTDYDMLGVQVIHETLHAGTPTTFVDFVIGGARGGGGSNYTGSWTETSEVYLTTPTTPTMDSTWGLIKNFYR